MFAQQIMLQINFWADVPGYWISKRSGVPRQGLLLGPLSLSIQDAWPGINIQTCRSHYNNLVSVMEVPKGCIGYTLPGDVTHFRNGILDWFLINYSYILVDSRRPSEIFRVSYIMDVELLFNESLYAAESLPRSGELGGLHSRIPFDTCSRYQAPYSGGPHTRVTRAYFLLFVMLIGAPNLHNKIPFARSNCSFSCKCLNETFVCYLWRVCICPTLVILYARGAKNVNCFSEDFAIDS